MNLEVNMSGKEYLDYKKYMDNNRIKLSKETKQALPFFIFAGLGAIMLFGLIHDLTYVAPAKEFTWNGIFMFLAICAGVAWLIHGFGFLLVRR